MQPSRSFVHAVVVAALAAQSFAQDPLSPAARSSALQLTTPLPPGASSSTASFVGSGGALPDLATRDFTLVVSGLGPNLWDVDLTTHIGHSWCGDLEIELFAPSGKRVTISNDNAEGYAQVFDGTLWDDSSPNSAYAYPYANYVTAPTLNSEGKFARLAGDDPNGTWTLRITDDAALDAGNLASWKLDLTTLAAPAPTPTAATTFASAPALAIGDLTVITDAITASGLGSNLAVVRVRVAITHTFNADLVLELVAPNGQTIRLASYIGAELDDVFDGTDIFDTASDAADPLLDAPIALYPYVDGVAATAVDPEGTFASLNGIDPNGTWTLRVEDTSPGDVGELASWQIALRTWDTPLPVSYCTAGTTTNGCAASIGANANPSVSFATPCSIAVTGVEGQKSAILFYGLSAHAAPWASNSSSFLCVKSPQQRLAAQSTGGLASQCDGALALDWNAYQSAHPTALGAPWVAGEKAFLQAWFRDPPAPKTTNLSNGLELTYQP